MLTGDSRSPTQPSLIPPNLHFEVDDFTEPWVFRKDSFDFIHARSLYGCVADWPAFYQEVLTHLQPGAYFEQVEMGVVPKSDDGTVEPGSIFDQWGKTSLLLGDKFGKSLRVVDESKGNMEAAGFVDVVEHRWKLPIGGWPADKRFKEIGQYNRIHWDQGIDGCRTWFSPGIDKGLVLSAKHIAISRIQTSTQSGHERFRAWLLEPRLVTLKRQVFCSALILLSTDKTIDYRDQSSS